MPILAYLIYPQLRPGADVLLLMGSNSLPLHTIKMNKYDYWITPDERIDWLQVILGAVAFAAFLYALAVLCAIL